MLKLLRPHFETFFWCSVLTKCLLFGLYPVYDYLFILQRTFYPWLGNTTPYVNNIKMATNFFSSIYCLSIEVSFPSRACAVCAHALVIILVSSQGTVCVCPMTFDPRGRAWSHFTVANKNVFCFVNLNNTHLACLWNISSLLLIRRFSIDSPVNLFGHTLEHTDKVAVKNTVWSLKGADWTAGRNEIKARYPARQYNIRRD